MLEVKGIKKKFRRKEVLNNVSFYGKKGEITALLGINGVGKSTLLKKMMEKFFLMVRRELIKLMKK